MPDWFLCSKVTHPTFSKKKFLYKNQRSSSLPPSITMGETSRNSGRSWKKFNQKRGINHSKYMSMPSSDTIVLTTNDFEISHRNRFIVQPKSYAAYKSDSEIADLILDQSNDLLFVDDLGVEVCGSRAYFNPESDGETAVYFSISRYGLKTQFSFPKIYTGNNANYFDARNTNEVFKTVQSLAKGAGLNFNILDSKISRIDTPKNANCKYGYSLYAPFVGQINNRMSNMVTYGSEYLRTGNKSNQVCFYGKDSKEKLYRLEPRLLNRDAVKSMSKKVGEITPYSISDLDMISEIYKRSTIAKMDIELLQKQFIETPNEMLTAEYLTQLEWEKAYLLKNSIALQLMEIEGIEMKLKNLNKTDCIRIRSKVVESMTDSKIFTMADLAILKLIESNYSGSTKRSKKKSYKDEVRRSTPTFITDESKQSISDEFIEKFLTV
jgi:hypothetical protein